jgi:gliding-associated putative ABC transporter substrate-binding component GldG
MKRSTVRANLFVQLGLVLLIAVLLNLLGVRYFKRLDLTTDRVHSLSQPTKTLMKRLERPLVVKVFFTKGLEAPYNNHERLFVEKLEEFQAWSDGRMRIEVVDPSEKLVEIVDGEEKTRTREQEALRLGVMPNQYQYRDRTRTELRQVYMGAAFLYGERQQIIPVVNQLSGLEYDVARAIKRLIDPEPARVGYTTGHGEVELSTDTRAPIQALRNQLAENNTMLVPVDLDGPTDQLDELEALLVVGPSSAFSPLSAFRLDQFLMSGRGVGVLLSNYQPHTESGEVVPIFHGLEGILGAYGIRHNRDLVLDRTSNSKMPLPVRRGRVVNMVNVNTPVIPVVHDLSMDSPIVRGIPMLTMPFSSTIELPEEETRDVVYTVLAKSSEESSRSQAVQKIDPYTLKEPGMAETKGASAVLVQARGVFSSAFANQEAPDPGPDAAEEIVVRESADARLVVSGTSHFMANNAMAMLNLVDWLVADLSLVDIRSKTLQLPNLNPMEASQVRILKFMNLLGPVFLILFFGLFRGFLRRRSS